MRILNEEAVIREATRIFKGWKKIKIKPRSRWNRLKWKILGEGAFVCALHDDLERIQGMTDKFDELLQEIEQGYYHIEVTLDDAGFHPLPCPLCHGEKTIRLRTEVVEYPLMGFFTPFMGIMLHDVYGECPVCRGSGYKPALTKGEEKLLKESKPLRKIDHL